MTPSPTKSLEEFLSPAGRLSYLIHQRKQEALAKARQIDLLQWTQTHRALLAPERPFNARPHLKTLYTDEAREIVIYKAAQLGASEYLVSWILWAADTQNATGLYLMPTDTHVSDFSAARLGPAIEPGVSAYLSKIIVSGDMTLQRGADRVGLKRVRNRFIYFRGAKVAPSGSAPQIKTIDADAIVLDELDEMDSRALTLARKRLLASQFAQVRLASTPSYFDMGIHAEYQKSDQRAWHLVCLSCNKYHAPTLDDLIIESDGLGRPIKWHEKDGVPFLKCPICDGMLDRENDTGQWIANYPTRAVHGYHLARLALHGKPLTDILTALQETNESKRQQVFNQDLGLPYTPVNAQSLSDSILNACMRDYGLGEIKKEQCYAGIDVGNMLHVVVRGTDADGNHPLRFAQALDSFAEAENILKKFDVRACVIDALPETRKVRELQSKFLRLKIWASYYTETGDATKKEQIGVWDPRELKVNVDRTRSLDATFSEFYLASKGEPGRTLPANIASVRDYGAHLKASQRILKENHQGEKIAGYIESGPDHFAHAENYATIARTCPYMTGWARGAGG